VGKEKRGGGKGQSRTYKRIFLLDEAGDGAEGGEGRGAAIKKDGAGGGEGVGRSGGEMVQ
jgi:hypothetical protein